MGLVDIHTISYHSIIVWIVSKQIKSIKMKFSLVQGQFMGRPLPLLLFAGEKATALYSFHGTGAENRGPHTHSVREKAFNHCSSCSPRLKSHIELSTITG